jgi:hypothetical protein
MLTIITEAVNRESHQSVWEGVPGPRNGADIGVGAASYNGLVAVFQAS